VLEGYPTQLEQIWCFRGANEPNYKELFAMCRESMDGIDELYVPMTKYGFLSTKL